MCPIENQQVYNVVALFNSLIFIELAVALVFVASYAVGSPRPDKHALYLLGRFFRRCEQLIRQHVDPHAGPHGRLGRWRYANRRNDLLTLPGKLRAWSGALATGAPDSTARVRELIDTVQGLAYRMRELLDTPRPPELDARSRELIDSLRSWRLGVERCFECWSTSPEAVPEGDLSARLAEGLARLEAQLESALDREDVRAHEPRDAARFYAMLGSYRSLSESLVAYANAARQVGIAGWREERF